VSQARDALADAGVHVTDIEDTLGIIQARAHMGVTGALWQSRALAALEARGLSRAEALRQMLEYYVEQVHTGEPVHLWRNPEVLPVLDRQRESA
jgi:hypothetical protein